MVSIHLYIEVSSIPSGYNDYTSIVSYLSQHPPSPRRIGAFLFVLKSAPTILEDILHQYHVVVFDLIGRYNLDMYNPSSWSTLKPTTLCSMYTVLGISYLMARLPVTSKMMGIEGFGSLSIELDIGPINLNPSDIMSMMDRVIYIRSHYPQLSGVHNTSNHIGAIEAVYKYGPMSNDITSEIVSKLYSLFPIQKYSHVVDNMNLCRETGIRISFYHPLPVLRWTIRNESLVGYQCTASTAYQSDLSQTRPMDVASTGYRCTGDESPVLRWTTPNEIGYQSDLSETRPMDLHWVHPMTVYNTFAECVRSLTTLDGRLSYISSQKDRTRSLFPSNIRNTTTIDAVDIYDFYYEDLVLCHGYIYTKSEMHLVCTKYGGKCWYTTLPVDEVIINKYKHKRYKGTTPTIEEHLLILFSPPHNLHAIYNKIHG
jgi:hypothetical protein